VTVISSRVVSIVTLSSLLLGGWGAAHAQTSPSPSRPWVAPDLREYTKAVKPTGEPLIDPQKRYELVELIDLAQRVNPETRVAWEEAHRAASAVGLVKSEYFPVLSIAALGGYKSAAFPAPENVAPDGFFRVDLQQVLTALHRELVVAVRRLIDTQIDSPADRGGDAAGHHGR
jgi:outer membrane protein TolC